MAKIANANLAYVADFWDRGEIKTFNNILRCFAHRIGLEIEGFDFDRKFYKEIAEIADDLVVEALLVKKKALIDRNKRKEPDPNIDPQDIYSHLNKIAKEMPRYRNVEPSHIVPSAIDDFVEIIIDIKHYGSRDWEMDELDKARKEREERKEREVDADEIEEEKSSILDCFQNCINCISGAIQKWNM